MRATETAPMLPEAKKLLSRARALHAEEYIRNEDFEVVLSFSLPVYHPSYMFGGRRGLWGNEVDIGRRMHRMHSMPYDRILSDAPFSSSHIVNHGVYIYIY